MVAITNQDDYIRTSLRAPPDLHKKIHEAAIKANRTFNAEIVQRIESSFCSPSGMTIDQLLAELAGRVRQTGADIHIRIGGKDV